jgi:Tc toxin complex TcA C-terminal TcB-binding domain/Neuraminidase-like domain/Salmonella virulence plasmid 28.1kDa A protein
VASRQSYRTQPDQRMMITGTIIDSTEQPLSDYAIVAYHGDVNLKRERDLRRGTTGGDGSYSLPIDLRPYPRGVNVRVAVLGKRAKEVWSSPIHYNVQSDVEIDGTITDKQLGISRYQRLAEKVDAQLQDTKLTELSASQRAYLAGRSGVSNADLDRLVTATRLHVASPEVSVETFYGMLSQGLPSAIDPLAALSESSWRKALANAISDDTINPLSNSAVAQTVKALASHKASGAIELSSPAARDSAFVSVAIPSKSKRNQIAALIARYNGTTGAFWQALARAPGITEKDITRLKNFADVNALLGQDPSLQAEVAAHVARGRTELTPSALARVKRSQWLTLAQNAARRNRSGPARRPTAGEKAHIELTAGIIAAQVAWKFPTQVLASEISDASAKGYFGKYKGSLAKFFAQNSDFDIRTGVDAVLTSRSGTVFRGIKNKVPVTERVKTLARLYRALPEAHSSTTANPSVNSPGIFERLSALADSKGAYRSSLAIARTNRAAFATELAGKSGDTAYWEQVHDQASAVSDVTQFNVVSLLQEARSGTQVMRGLFPGSAKNIAIGSKGSELEDGPANLRTLFGTLDGCQCEQCTSVTSPASYLADILNFLEIEVAAPGSAAPYDVLVARRPDIPHILLNCDNTNVELPYIDVVNELLEDEVLRQTGADPVWAPYQNVTIHLSPLALDIAAFREPPLGTQAKVVVATVLNASLPGYDFDADLQVSVRRWSADGVSGNRWFVFNKGWLVELSYDGTSQGSSWDVGNDTPISGTSVGPAKRGGAQPVSVDYISRQTYGTSAELAANPLFRNARVTAFLETVEFPPSLPPGLPLLEARLFLAHLKLPREQLIRELVPANVTAWAAEYLGMSAADIDQINTAGTQKSWGFGATTVTSADMLVDPNDSTILLTGNWLDLLKRVDVLIARARISYIDLLELLETDFVNPARANGLRAVIVSIDASDPATCDLSKLRIQLDTKSFQLFLDRMRCFLRMKRRIGWATPDLDLALRQLGIDLRLLQRAKGAAALGLIPLAILKQMKSALSLSHADACSLLGKIDTKRTLDYRADGQPARQSPYEALFLNRATTSPVDSRFLLLDDRSDLRAPPAAQDSAATVAAAFKVSESDIGLILGLPAIAPAGTLTLDLLSQIYRRVLLARGFGLSVQQLIWIEQLNGGLPSIDQYPDFVMRVNALRHSRISVTEAWYLLADADAATAFLVPGDDDISQRLDEIRTQIASIETDHVMPGPVDNDGTQLRKVLGELDFGAPLIDDVLGAVSDTKLFSVSVTLSQATIARLDLDAGVSLTLSANQQAFLKNVDTLVRYRNGDAVLAAIHPLSRADRATLLQASSNNAFRSAFETLYALGKLSYANGVLTCRGLLPSGSATAIKQSITNATFGGAIDDLRDQQQKFLERKLRYGGLAQYEFPLASATPIEIPEELQPYVYLDQARSVLVVRGQPTDLELERLSSDSKVPATILNSFGATQPPVKVNTLADLLTSADVAALFDPAVSANMSTTIADISKSLLAKLTPAARGLLEDKAIVTTLASALGLTITNTQYLLKNLPSATAASSMADALASLSRAGSPTDPAPYEEDYRRLSKIALLLKRLNVQETQLPWLFNYGTADWLQATNLQVGAATGGVHLEQLTELIRLFAISGRSPYSATLVDQILKTAADATVTTVGPVVKLISDNSKWMSSDLSAICASLGVTGPRDFLVGRTCERIYLAMTDLAQLGATADQGLQLTSGVIDDVMAAVAKSLANSKHLGDGWAAIVAPINDTLREVRRAALVDYLVTYPRRVSGTTRPLWWDVDSLYEYLLVDVQMSACMTTSRIRLALNSVQLFVQRCLMNLEAAVTIGDDSEIRRHWNEWDNWRKLYRVWEANRKVFLYPEDWMDPTLRDDKTPFFKDLENELLQGDVTEDTAEAAFLEYLGKLDHVSKLEVMGLFLEIGSPFYDPDSNKYETRQVLHLVARTFGEPHDWFYRTLTSTYPNPWHEGLWSAWEKIDADVEGDHILPVVWNGHLYLFWAMFDQKADKQTSEELNNRSATQGSRNRWYIRFAWSERRNGKWMSKRMSKDSLRTPCFDSGDQTLTTDDFAFNTRITNNQITINCYGPPADDQPSDTGTTGASTTVTPKDPPLYSGTSQVSIDFVDPTTDHWRTDINITVYQGDGELFSLQGSNSNGRFDLWSYFGWSPIPDWWKNAIISVTTSPKVVVVYSFPPATRDNGQQGTYQELTYKVQISANTPTGTGGASPVTVEDQPLTQGPDTTVPSMSGIGRFELEVCRSDLTPIAATSPQTLPLLDASVIRRGMMYVENEDPDPSKGLPSQPALWGALPKTPPGPYRILLLHQYSVPVTNDPFIFQTDREVFLVTIVPGAGYRFNVLYHPFTCDFITTAAQEGIDELLTLQSQSKDDGGANFQSGYSPETSQVQVTEPDADQPTVAVAVTREYVDFTSSGAYSIYNWELFFHIPWLIATQLKANQRFEEARKWFHYIFDPTTRPGAFKPAPQLTPTQRFWNVMPFWKAEGKPISSIDDLLRAPAGLSEAFREWREDPFEPFVVARARPSAFMRSVVLSYIDNLIQWGDQQFAQFTDESTNEATLLYVLASDILGRAPEKIPPRALSTMQNYLSLQEQATGGTSPLPTWQNFSDVMVEIEAFIPPSAAIALPGTSSSLGRMWAFCVPPNDQLLQCWPRVAQSLFNLRNCRDLEGVERRFPLWDPPIDPGLLVRAAAAGIDLASVLSDINAATPHYRFSVLYQKALEFCNEVRNFGAALLAALEKSDAEGLSLLRAQQDVALQMAVRQVRQSQLQQSTAQREAAEKSRITVEARRDHYANLAFMNPWEIAATTLSGLAITQEIGAGIADALGAIAALVPQFAGGTSGYAASPVVTTTLGGQQIAGAASATASAARTSASILSSLASGSQTLGGYNRRQEDWTLQETLASKELDQIDKQILSAQIQEQIAQAELDNHDLQTENTQAVEDYLKSKYTNQQLYGWMQGQLSSLYFQAYKLAFDVARKTELAFRHELGVTDTSYIQFGYWDSLKKGLLSGDRLLTDLRRMEAAYLDQNSREFEISKNVSLASLNPAALILLRVTGRCEFDMPELLFDMDYPGHFMRRIKSVALSIPCVVGPYTSVNCTLTQLYSKVRLPDSGLAEYADPGNFHEFFGNAESIVTSSAKEDSGLFELNFRDERYLPFEGTGAISRWRVELPLERNQFDLQTVSDVIFHIRYTARYGGDSLKDAATPSLPMEGVRAFSVKQEFPSAWYLMRTDAAAAGTTSADLMLAQNRFPFFFANGGVTLTVKTVNIYTLPTQDAGDRSFPQSLKLYLPPAPANPPDNRPSALKGAADASIGQLAGKTFTADVAVASTEGAAATWTVEVDDPAAFAKNVDDLLIVCEYELATATGP